MNRNERGIARSDIAHMSMCVDSGHERHEVPEVVVRGLGLRERAVGLLLRRVDEVGELDRVLDEEDRDVVADEVPVALTGVELRREPADVARQVHRALVADHGGEPDEDRRLLARSLEEVGARDVCERLVALEVAVGAVPAGVHDALGDALVVEVEDLLTEVEVLEQRRTPLAGAQRVLVVGDRNPLSGGQDGVLLARDLMRVPALAALDDLVAVAHARPLPVAVSVGASLVSHAPGLPGTPGCETTWDAPTTRRRPPPCDGPRRPGRDRTVCRGAR
jgi:hypothetical protein